MRKEFKLSVNLIYGIAFIFVMILLFAKCRYGFANMDEGFYLTIPYRLYRNDALFVHEWHLSQMGGALTYPFVALYMKIFGTTESMMLSFRYLFTVFHCITTLFLYVRLKKLDCAAACVASLSYALYAPFGIMALSYNSIGIAALCICMVSLLTAEKYKKMQFIVAGAFGAVSVLCCPYLAAVYFLYLVIVGVRLIKIKQNELNVLSLKGSLWFTVGIVIIAVCFIGFVLSRASVSDIIKAFPHIMNDPEHEPVSFFESTKNFFLCIWSVNAGTPFIYSLLIPLGIFAVIVRNKKKAGKTVFLIASVLTFALMLCHYFLNDYLNHLMWSLNILAIFAVILTKQSIIKKIFCMLWLPGILYAFCINMTSNQEFYALSSAASVATFGSIMMTIMFLKEIVEKSESKSFGRLITGIVAVIMLFQIFGQGYMRYSKIFWDKDINHQTMLIESGPEKGIYVTERKYNIYTSKQKDIARIKEYNPQNVLFLSMHTWYCLLGDYDLSTYSAWLSGVNEHSISRLKSYYELNPDKIPNVVYADEEYIDVVSEFCTELGFEKTKADTGYIFY